MLNGLLFKMNEKKTSIEITKAMYKTEFKGEGGLYNLLGCSMIEFAYIELEGETYTLVCDEEGLLTGQTTTMLLVDGITSQVHRGFVGTLLLTKMDAKGEFVTMTVDEMEVVNQLFSPMGLSRSDHLGQVYINYKIA